MLGLYNTDCKSFPSELPIMPLRGTILMPRSELQIPISEIENLLSISNSLKHNQYIGVVQSRSGNNDDEILFKCGCLGKILDIQEVESIGLVVSIQGICRFEIDQETIKDDNCRFAKVSYQKYSMDVVHEADFSFDRERLITALKLYCKKLKIHPNWKEINGTSNEKLITMLMMICPFDSLEKQALLEAVSYTEQSKLITSIIEMEAKNHQIFSQVYH